MRQVYVKNKNKKIKSMVCRVNTLHYPKQQSGGVICSHQAVDGLKEPPQRILKLCLLLPLVQPRMTRGN